MDQLNLRLQDVDGRIHSLLEQTCRERWKSFSCTHTILYLPDNYSSLLEPIFMLPGVGDQSLEPLPVSGVDSQGADTFLATIAFASRQPKFSCDPWNDRRLSQSAIRLVEAYGMRGAVIAFPLCVRPDHTPLGVWIICADTTLNPPGEVLNQQISDEFREMVIRLTYLLGLREAILATEVSANYQRLSYELFAQMRPISTHRDTATLFRDSCRDLLRAEHILLDISFADRPIDSVSDSPLGNLGDSLAAGTPVVLNRCRVAPDLYKALSDPLLPTKRLAWAGLQLTDHDAKLTCFAGRTVETLADHWTTHEVTLLHTSLRFLQLALKRTSDFDRLVGQLTSMPALARTTSRSFSEPVFESVYEICKEHLGIDQMLVTSVQREATHLLVKGVWAKGFGDKDSFIQEETRRALYTQNGTETRPDILTFILDDCVNARDAAESPFDRSQLYRACVGESNNAFRLDDAVVAECGLTGPIYFLPCFSASGDDKPVLRSILHLGQSAGALRLGNEAEPILHALSRTVADALARDEDERMRHVLERIYAQKDLTSQGLRELAAGVSQLCSSLGSALFLNARLLPLVGDSTFEEANLVDAFLRLFNAFNTSGWEIIPSDVAKKLRTIVGAYLGIQAELVPQAVASGPRHLASLLGASLYVCVAHTDRAPPGNNLCEILSLAEKDPDDEQFAGEFARLLVDQCYLPGYGLTGWCLRYQHTMCLPNKNQVEVDAFFNATEGRLEVAPMRAIVETLRFLQPPIESSLARNPIQRPTHADHIRDCMERSQREDAFLAVPLEGMEDGVAASGVLRTSTSITLRPVFEDAAVVAMNSVAQHLSLLLRGEQVRQRSFVQRYSDFEQLRNFLRHKLNRFATALRHLEGTCDTLMGSADREAIQAPIDELKSICGGVVRERKYEKLLKDLSAIKDPTSVHSLEEMLQESTESTCYCSRVVVKVAESAAAGACASIRKDKVLPLFLLIDEVVTNSARHCRPNEIVILLFGEDALSVQVVEGECGLEASLREPISLHNDHRPYALLLNGKGEGGEMIRKLAIETGLAVVWTEYQNGYKVYMLAPTPSEQAQPIQETVHEIC